METPSSKRRSTRTRQSVSYQESPVEIKSMDKSMKSLEVAKNSPVEVKSRGRKKSMVVAEEDVEYVSPKKLRNNRTPSTKALESIVTESSPTIEKIDSTRRRSTRTRTPNYRYQTPTKNSYDDSIETIDIIDDSLNESYDDKENKLKPTTLFDEEEDVEGRKLYSFKTPKKREGMSQLANQTPKTPRHHDLNATTPRTPKHQRLSEIQKTPTSRPSASKYTKTPRHIRDETRKRLNRVKYREMNSEDDFSADESEYDPNESSSSSSSSASSESEHEQVEEEVEKKKKPSVASRVLKTPSASAGLRRSSRIKNETQYVLQCDNYFSTQSSKTKTSDNTLDRLKNPRMAHDELIKMLSSMQMSKEHEIAIKELNEEYKLYFDKWLNLFDMGFNVILHGIGSKRNLLQTFHQECLAKQHVLVINGFFPSITIKDILDSIAGDIMEMTSYGSTPHEIVSAIEEEMKGPLKAIHIFLIVHNIDGAMLRNDKSQTILSRLAAIKNIHLISSVDHINTPLLWNNTKLSNYNFKWFDVTSYLPYVDETAYDNSLMITNSGALELSSLRSVFQSLTNNARGIYLLLVKYQLKNGSNAVNYQGMAFKDLYTSCREAFLVSSDIALRAQLTEFLDHKLAKMKRSVDGAENITLPIKNSLLEKFLSEQS